MAIGKTIHFEDIENLWLDPQNPRIGRAKRKENLDQVRLLQVMAPWTLDELVDSFMSAGGFWTQDALIVVREDLEGAERLIVVEGNRRLAALKMMRNAIRNPEGAADWLK